MRGFKKKIQKILYIQYFLVISIPPKDLVPGALI